MTTDVTETLRNTISNSLLQVINFIPQLVSGLIVLLLGIIIGAFVKQVILELFKLLKLDTFLKRYGVPETREGINWGNVLAELLRWFIIILFLVPAADIWGLDRFVQVLNGLLLYLPNVLVAVLLILIGFVISGLVYKLILASVHGVSSEVAKTVATVGRWAIIIFVFLVALNQLGIATDLIRILFAGIVAMFAIAGGLAFGLGGRDAAKQMLERMIKRL